MSKILPFRPPKASERQRGKTLCRHGHHKWRIDAKQHFDTRQGRLVTRFVCQRCGKVRVRAL